MDKNTIIGFILIAAIIIGFGIYNQPSKEEIEKMRKDAEQRRDSMEQIEKKRELDAKKANTPELIVDSLAAQNADSLKKVEVENKFGAFADAATGEEKFISIENNKIKAIISSKGGRVYSVQIKGYKKFDSTDVVLFNGDDNKFGFNFFAQNRRIETNELFFVPQTRSEVIDASNSAQSLKMRLKAGNDKYIEFEYKLKPNSYVLDFIVNFKNVNDLIGSTNSYIDLHWQANIPSQEKGRTWENDNTTIYYRYADDEVDYLTETKDNQDERIPTRMKWIAFKQQFFSTVLIANNYMEGVNLAYIKLDTSKVFLKKMTADISLPYEGKGNEMIPMSFYFGPNKYKILKDTGEEADLALQQLIPLGWGIFGWVNRFIVIPLFNFLGNYIANFGIIILIMTIIIKVGLFPLTYRSYLSSAKMRVLKPQIEEINKKIPADKAMERQQATMSLYRKVGVNPMGGCFPMLLQLPILIAMFRFFPASIELRQQSFLWATDLSTYDSILNLPFEIPFYGDHISLFCLLMAASMYLTTKMSSDQMDTGNPQMAGMKMMMYIMPIMMLFWFNNYSSGLSYYYLLTNIISYGQTIGIRRFVNEADLLKKLEQAAAKKKPQVKSKFQLKLEEMAKQKGYKPPK